MNQLKCLFCSRIHRSLPSSIPSFHTHSFECLPTNTSITGNCPRAYFLTNRSYTSISEHVLFYEEGYEQKLAGRFLDREKHGSFDNMRLKKNWKYLSIADFMQWIKAAEKSNHENLVYQHIQKNKIYVVEDSSKYSLAYIKIDHWKPPMEDEVKINVSASCRDQKGQGGYSGVFRDPLGFIKFHLEKGKGFYHGKMHATSIGPAEIYCVRMAAVEAKVRGYPKAIIESDSMITVKVLNSSIDTWKDKFHDEYMEAYDAMMTLDDCSVIYCPRELNVLAHYIVKEEMKNMTPSQYIIDQIAREDRNGVPRYIVVQRVEFDTQIH